MPSLAAGLSIGLCLAFATPPSPKISVVNPIPPLPVFIETQSFTLEWQHSIEKTYWQEDYEISLNTKATPLLTLKEARIQSSGAGMEPPAEALYANGWYHYSPKTNSPLPPINQDHPLRLTRSPYTQDYRLCLPPEGACRPLDDYLPSDGNITLLWPCQAN